MCGWNATGRFWPPGTVQRSTNLNTLYLLTLTEKCHAVITSINIKKITLFITQMDIPCPLFLARDSIQYGNLYTQAAPVKRWYPSQG